MICALNVTCRTSTIFDIGFIGYYCQMALEYFVRTEEKQRKLCHVVYFPALGFRNWSDKLGASSRWSFGPNPASWSKETTTIKKTHPTLPSLGLSPLHITFQGPIRGVIFQGSMWNSPLIIIDIKNNPLFCEFYWPMKSVDLTGSGKIKMAVKVKKER